MVFNVNNVFNLNKREVGGGGIPDRALEKQRNREKHEKKRKKIESKKRRNYPPFSDANK